MKRYVLFTEEELYDLLNGGETEHNINGVTVYFMSVDQFASMSGADNSEEHYYEGKNLYLD